MKKLSLFVLMLILTFNMSAQNETQQKYSLTSTSNQLGFASLSILDPYLSPLVYSGIGMKFEHTERRFFSPENTKLSMEGKIRALAALTLNPEYTTSTTYIGANYSWGMHYHFQIREDFQILAGGTADAVFGFKSNARNVNNPVNLDMATNLNLSGVARYDFKMRRRTLRLSYTMEIPLLGFMYVPYGGASYYEMFDLGNLSDAFHFSSLHNKLGSSGSVMLDVPFKHSTWRFGVNTSKLKYQANNMVFEQNEFSLMIGCKYDLHIFAGTKTPAPSNFISTDK